MTCSIHAVLFSISLFDTIFMGQNGRRGNFEKCVLPNQPLFENSSYGTGMMVEHQGHKFLITVLIEPRQYTKHLKNVATSYFPLNERLLRFSEKLKAIYICHSEGVGALRRLLSDNTEEKKNREKKKRILYRRKMPFFENIFKSTP